MVQVKELGRQVYLGEFVKVVFFLEWLGAFVTQGGSAINQLKSDRRAWRWPCCFCQCLVGGYEQEEHAAEAYDIAALKCKGRRVKTNFAVDK